MSGAQKLTMGHVTLTTPIREQFVIQRLTLDIAYTCDTKYDTLL